MTISTPLPRRKQRDRSAFLDLLKRAAHALQQTPRWLVERARRARRLHRDERELRALSAQALSDLGIGASEIAASLRHGRHIDAATRDAPRRR